MDTPVGAVLRSIEVAYLMSWGGFSRPDHPIWLVAADARRVRGAVRSSMTHVLFDIGMFPVIMSVAAVVFVDPGLRRIAGRSGLRGLGRR
jgi:hypothetical protein